MSSINPIGCIEIIVFSKAYSDTKYKTVEIYLNSINGDLTYFILYTKRCLTPVFPVIKVSSNRLVVRNSLWVDRQSEFRDGINSIRGTFDLSRYRTRSMREARFSHAARKGFVLGRLTLLASITLVIVESLNFPPLPSG